MPVVQPKFSRMSVVRIPKHLPDALRQLTSSSALQAQREQLRATDDHPAGQLHDINRLSQHNRQGLWLLQLVSCGMHQDAGGCQLELMQAAASFSSFS